MPINQEKIVNTLLYAVFKIFFGVMVREQLTRKGNNIIFYSDETESEGAE